MCCSHMWFLFFIYQLKSQIKYILHAAVEFVENITHIQESMYPFILALQRKAVFKRLCPLRITYTA